MGPGFTDPVNQYICGILDRMNAGSLDAVPGEGRTLLTLPMDFPERLTTLRKNRGLTQAQLADAIDLHVAQIGRYENGTSQPTLDVIRRLATTLNVTADLLVFDNDERGPDDDLRLAFEATRQLDDDERRTVRDVIEAILLKHDARRWTNAS